MLDVTRLRVLVAVARHGSVTAAAHALNYAQPSVSHHLARLEAETGTKLVQRAGRGIRLTDAGRLLAERAVEVIGRLDAAENELAVFAGLRAGRLRLAAFPSALGTIVPAAAAGTIVLSAEGKAASRSRPARSPEKTASSFSAASRRPITSTARSASSRPASVSRMPRPARCTSLMPVSASSRARWWLTDGWA